MFEKERKMATGNRSIKTILMINTILKKAKNSRKNVKFDGDGDLFTYYFCFKSTDDASEVSSNSKTCI